MTVPVAPSPVSEVGAEQAMPGLAAAVSTDLHTWALGLPPRLKGAFDSLMAGSGVGADQGAAAYLHQYEQIASFDPETFESAVRELGVSGGTAG